MVATPGAFSTLSATGCIQALVERVRGSYNTHSYKEKNEGKLFLKGLPKMHQCNQCKGNKAGLIKCHEQHGEYEQSES